jgi:hypothetical protein
LCSLIILHLSIQQQSLHSNSSSNFLNQSDIQLKALQSVFLNFNDRNVSTLPSQQAAGRICPIAWFTRILRKVSSPTFSSHGIALGCAPPDLRDCLCDSMAKHTYRSSRLLLRCTFERSKPSSSIPLDQRGSQFCHAKPSSRSAVRPSHSATIH